VLARSFLAGFIIGSADDSVMLGGGVEWVFARIYEDAG